jgi:hypothetical protein
MQVYKIKKATKEELFELSLRSAQAGGEVYIYEQADLSALLGHDEAEQIRQVFLASGTKVKQLTNTPTIPAFTGNQVFVDVCMTFRFVPVSVYEIQQEMIIFDDIVACYTVVGEEIELLVIEDHAFAKQQKQLFMQVWDQGLPPRLNFPYHPNHSFYQSEDIRVLGVQVIVYPDKDAKAAFGARSWDDISELLTTLFKKDEAYYRASAYVIVFMWSYNGDRMFDVWRFTENHVDDRSGPLGEVMVYRNEERCTDLGLASGNTLLVLGHEERLRRQSADTTTYLKGKSPQLPLEICNNTPYC